MKWWNELNILDKTLLSQKYYEDGNFWQILSSENIKLIYEKQIDSVSNLKPKEIYFNEENFKKHISKFSDEDKIKAYDILCNLIPKEIMIEHLLTKLELE